MPTSNARLLAAEFSVYAATKLTQLIPLRPASDSNQFFQHWNISIVPALSAAFVSELLQTSSNVSVYYLEEWLVLIVYVNMEMSWILPATAVSVTVFTLLYLALPMLRLKVMIVPSIERSIAPAAVEASAARRADAKDFDLLIQIFLILNMLL